MKILKKFLKLLLIFTISTLITYLLFTIAEFYNWCDENQLILFKSGDISEEVLNLDSDKIEEIGMFIRTYSSLLEESLDSSYYEENGDYHSVAEYYDSVGYAVWVYIQDGISNLTMNYIGIAILVGIGITLAFAIITSSKINSIFKVIIGYFGVLIIVPYLLQYGHFYRIIGLNYAPDKKTFYIIYTIAFIGIYVINYIVGKNMTKKLNTVIADVNKK